MPTCFRNRSYSQAFLDPWPWQRSACDTWGGSFVRQSVFRKSIAPFLWKCCSHVSETVPNTLLIPLCQKRGTESRGSLTSAPAQQTYTALCSRFDKALPGLFGRESQPTVLARPLSGHSGFLTACVRPGNHPDSVLISFAFDRYFVSVGKRTLLHSLGSVSFS